MTGNQASSIWRLTADRFIVTVMSVFAAVHLAMLVLVPDAAQKLLLGDRAQGRLSKLELFLSATTWDDRLAALFREGSPGDFLLFAPAYALAGPVGVILQNIVLFVIGLFFLYRIGFIFSSRVARIAAIAWCLTPATLFHPQTLASESICNPLLIVATFFLLKLLLSDDVRWRDVVAVGVLLAVLVFVRHVYVLLPIAIALVLLVFMRDGRPRPLSVALTVLVLGYSITSATGLVALPENSRNQVPDVGGLESNLYLRAERMAAMGGFSLPAEVDARKQAARGLGLMTPGEFASLAREHPGYYLKSVASDLVNHLANPGASMLFGRYLQLYDLDERNPRDMGRWREIRETGGFSALLRALWDVTPTGFIITALAGSCWLAFLSIATFGGIRFAFSTGQPLPLRVAFWIIPTYIALLSCTSAGYSRWDHRSPMEFILALFFALVLSPPALDRMLDGYALNRSARRHSPNNYSVNSALNDRP